MGEADHKQSQTVLQNLQNQGEISVTGASWSVWKMSDSKEQASQSVLPEQPGFQAGGELNLASEPVTPRVTASPPQTHTQSQDNAWK